MTGWVNVPADCVRTLRKIHLHAQPPQTLQFAKKEQGFVAALQQCCVRPERDPVVPGLARCTSAPRIAGRFRPARSGRDIAAIAAVRAGDPSELVKDRRFLNSVGFRSRLLAGYQIGQDIECPEQRCNEFRSGIDFPVPHPVKNGLELMADGDDAGKTERSGAALDGMNCPKCFLDTVVGNPPGLEFQ